MHLACVSFGEINLDLTCSAAKPVAYAKEGTWTVPVSGEREELNTERVGLALGATLWCDLTTEELESTARL